MKTTYLASTLGLLAVAVLTPAAMAADAFSGFYISGGIGQKNANTELGVSGGGAAGSLTLGDTSVAGQLAGGYSFALTPELRLGLGAFYDVGDGKSGGATATLGTVSATYALKETRHYGISVEPGYAFTKESVAYAKLMYNWIRGEASLSGAATGSASQTFNAFGYGFGLKHLVGSNAYLFAEWQQTQYGTNSFPSGGATVTYKPKETLGLIGIGVTF